MHFILSKIMGYILYAVRFALKTQSFNGIEFNLFLQGKYLDQQ